jgi:predicted aminopeptidase
MEHVQSARAELKKLYVSSVDEREKREQKQMILTALREAASQEVDRTGRRTPGWLKAPLNNASLIPLTLYQGRLAEFRELLQECDEDLHCFYGQAEALAK